MKATEFCYWLQGAFEQGALDRIGPKAGECIRKHLALTEATKPDDSPEQVRAFCGWLGGALDLLASDDYGAVRGAETIKTKLSSIFEHVIDKLYPGGDALKEPTPARRIVLNLAVDTTETECGGCRFLSQQLCKADVIITCLALARDIALNPGPCDKPQRLPECIAAEVRQ